MCAVALLLYMSVGFPSYRLLGFLHRNLLLIYWSTPLKLPIKNKSVWSRFFFFFWMHVLNGSLFSLGKKNENMKEMDQILCKSSMKVPSRVQGKVTTLVWPLHAGQISHDICWTATYLARQMKMETRMMDVNRIYQSTRHRSFPPKEKLGDLPPSLRLPWQRGLSVKADNLFCSKLGNICVVKCLSCFWHKWLNVCLINKTESSLLSCLDAFLREESVLWLHLGACRFC